MQSDIINADDLKAFIATEVHKAIDDRLKKSKDVMQVDGSYDPTDGTAEFLFGDTAADEPTSETRVPIGTAGIGDQYGPRGDNQAKLVNTQSGWVALFRHDGDNSPGAPSGEFWRCHINEAGEIDAFTKHTNNGAAGDGKGGISHLMGSKGTAQTAGGHTQIFDDAGRVILTVSSGGHQHVLDDALKQIRSVSSGGAQHVLDDTLKQIRSVTHAGASHVLDDIANTVKTSAIGGSIYHILDGGGNEIASVASQIGVGARFGNLSPSNAPILNEHLTTFSSGIDTQRLTDMVTLTTTLVPHLINGASALAAVEALVLSHLSVPAGSASVRAIS